MKTRLIALVVLMVVVAVPTGAATTMPNLIVGVTVALKPHSVTLSAKQVRRGNYVEFKVRNMTTHKRTFSIAGRKVAVPPRKNRLLVIPFSVRGTYTFVSRGAGVAVHGTFRVN